MTAVHPSSFGAPRVRGAESPRSASVELAGTAWPLFKLEALALGFVALLVLLLVTGSAATAVLGGAGLAAARWVVADRVARGES